MRTKVGFEISVVFKRQAGFSLSEFYCRKQRKRSKSNRPVAPPECERRGYENLRI